MSFLNRGERRYSADNNRAMAWFDKRDSQRQNKHVFI
jgi:hypothetical protein